MLKHSLQQEKSSATAFGWIPYANLLPLKTELIKSHGAKVILNEAHPVVVNRMLIEGKVAFAPCSSICLLNHQSVDIAFPLGVAAAQSVQSVYLGVNQEYAFITNMISKRLGLIKEIISHAKTTHSGSPRSMSKSIWQAIEDLPDQEMVNAPGIRFSPNSASSVTLAKVFYRMVFGQKAYEQNVQLPYSLITDAKDYGLELVIGDDALNRRHEFPKIIDLGSVWNELTGLPFVFAVWQKHVQRPTNGWAQRMMEVAELAQARMHIEPCRYFDSSGFKETTMTFDLARYWRGLHYRLTPEDMQGLMLFLCLAKELDAMPADDRILVKLMRWQEKSQAASSQ